MIQHGRWYFGLRFGKFSLFLIWMSERSAQAYARMVIEELEGEAVMN